MPNKGSGQGDQNRKSTSSGHGALGMGGQPSDDSRDLKAGREGWDEDDRGSGTGPIPGASGGRKGDLSAGSVAGVQGDRAVEQDIERETTAPEGK